MGTEFLRPQDYFVERFPVFHGQRNGHGYNKTNNINNNGYRKSTVVRTDHKKRFQNQNHQHQQQKETTSPKNDLEMGQVTIVRRGDSLDSINSRIKKDRRNQSAFDPADTYAGSACSVSPSPSSLPLPTFFKKQELKSFDDSATRDLRRLLRLE